MESLRKKLVEKFVPITNSNDEEQSGTTGSYSESTLRQYWMPDQVAHDCYDCASKFTTFRRKHHCRICGQIFCSGCCGIFISGRYLNVTGSIRVCNKCHKRVESSPPRWPQMLQSSTSDARHNSQRRSSIVDESLSQRFSNLATKSGSDSDLSYAGASGSSHHQNERKSSYAGFVPNSFMSESCDNISDLGAQKSHINVQRLVQIWQKLMRKNPTHTGSSQRAGKVIISLPDTFSGEELVNWLLEYEGLKTRKNAVEVAQALLDGEIVYDPTASVRKDILGGLYKDDLLLKVRKTKIVLDRENDILEEDPLEGNIVEGEEQPDWLQNIEHSRRGNVSPRNLRVQIRKSDTNEKMSSPVNHELLSKYLNNFDSIGLSSEIPCPALDDVYIKHQDHYLDQLLDVEKLDKKKWTWFIKAFCNDLLNEVKFEPSMNAEKILMDFTDLIKIKCISEGRQNDSRIVRGEVFTNNVVRSDMPMSAVNVRLLLVKESISYHRPDKFVSISNLHLQEEEFVKNICNKIKALEPDLILVGKSIVRGAQDELVKAGISVIQNVKEKNLIRVAKFFGAEIVTSLDSLVNIPTLVVCGKFHSVYYEHQNKNLVYLEGSKTSSQWGCCMVLRGGTRKELAKVKRAMNQYMLLKTHATLEKSFILDEPSQGENFIVPNYAGLEVTQLCLSPFIQLPLPENEAMKLIRDDCAAQEDPDEPEKTNKPAPIATTEPLVLTTTIQNDRRVRNLLADMRAAPVKIRSSSIRPKLSKLPKAPLIYNLLNRSLPVSFCSYLTNVDGGSRYCVKPWVSAMKYYRDNDLPLGLFLRSYCFDKKVRCLSTQEVQSTGPSNSGISTSQHMNTPMEVGKSVRPCTIPMCDHGRRFCLDNTSITLIVQDLKSNECITDPKDDDKIAMWKYCPECQTMTNIQPLSSDAWKLSYGMFLTMLVHESKMVRGNVISCDHSLHNIQYTCFGRHDQIAFFKMQTIHPHGVKMPPTKINLPPRILSEKDLNDELFRLSVQGTSVFAQLHSKLIQLQREFEPNSTSVLYSNVRDLIEAQKTDQESYRQKIQKISVELNHENDAKDLIKGQSDMLMLKISIIKDVTSWRIKLSKLADLKKKEDKIFARANSKSRVASGNSLLSSHEEQQHMSLPVMTSTLTTGAAVPIEVKKDEEPKKKLSSGSSASHSVLNEPDFINVTNPYSNTVHPDLYLKPYILVDEGQPSSIIAYALGSTEHAEFLFNADDRKSYDHSFYDNGGNDKFFVKVHFASEFHNFRKKIFESGHDHQDFIASLAGCEQWQSSGGKSGASFYKTIDGRFLLKQINKHEIDTFKNIAPKYFEYITNDECPSLMAKIIGLYTVGYKTLNGARKLDVVVMENLFHKHKIVESFDLKGSMRNRFVDSSGNNVQGKELVLMDENLLRMACDRPFYVSHKTKSELKMAVERDSKFLCDIKVMDYSLLVGKDDTTNELVVGIIDYLRPFSIDKVIESQMKKTSGYFQGNVEDPTVISPSAYQSRFISAMDNYFVLLPNYWYDLPAASNFDTVQKS